MNTTEEQLKYIDIFPNDAGKLAQKLHIKKEEIPYIRKFYVAEKGEVNEDERSIVAVVSTADRDRQGEIVEPKGIDLTAYLKNSVLMWSHRYSDPPIGRSVWSKVDDKKGLICKFQFAKTKFADEIYQLYKEGFLKAFSIGFIPLDFDEKEKIHKKISLLEVSAVPVPANENALITEAYQKGLITSSILKKDLEIVAVVDEQPVEVEPTIGEMTEAMGLDVEEDAEKEVVEIVAVTHPVEKAEDVPELTGLVKSGDVYFIETNEKEEEESEVVTKPETTDDYHRIPVSEGHDGHEIKTITVSAKKGIKALYCVTCKKIKTYLFDVDKWTMEEAQAWVNSHKSLLERYERSLAKREFKDEEDEVIVEIEEEAEVETGAEEPKSFSDIFNKKALEYDPIPDDMSIEDIEAMPAGFKYAVCSKYLKCKVKDIYPNSMMIAWPLLGNYLSAFKEILKEYDLKEIRNFTQKGTEAPPQYRTIQLNSKRSDDFLVEGMCFYEGENMLVIHPDECIDCGVCEPECPVDAIKPDTEPGLEKWLELNRQYADKWPNLTAKKASLPDAEAHKDEAGKFEKYFSPNPGEGD